MIEPNSFQIVDGHSLKVAQIEICIVEGQSKSVTWVVPIRYDALRTTMIGWKILNGPLDCLKTTLA